MAVIEAPHIIDDENGEINATRNGRFIRGWSYKDETEWRWKMKMAREFCEGWHQANRDKQGAPELLAKLVEIRKWMDTDVCGPWDAKFIADIDALVARAEGRSHD